MRRREFIRLVGGATLAAPLAALAEEARTHRVGCLWPFPRGTREASLLADALRPYGFIDGQNLTIDYRPWALHVDQIWDYAADFVKEIASMRFPPAVIWLFAPRRKRRHPFRSLA